MKTLDVKTIDYQKASKALREALNGQPVIVVNAGKLDGFVAGLKHGEIIIEGSAGDYLGVLNDGAKITVKGNTGQYLADNMTQGSIFVEGDTGYGAGQYCYGGLVIVHGNAGDFTATMNKGATIIINGNVGDEAGTYMLKGDLVVVGDAGDNFANYLIRGNVYLGGQAKSMGHNTRVEPLTDEDVAKLRSYFETYQIKAASDSFKKIVAASEKPFYH